MVSILQIIFFELLMSWIKGILLFYEGVKHIWKSLYIVIVVVIQKSL